MHLMLVRHHLNSARDILFRFAKEKEKKKKKKKKKISFFSSQGTFKIPYFKTVVPITAWTDTQQNIQRVEYYNGLDTYLYRYDTGMTYEVVPVINQYQCMSSNVSGGPTTFRKRQSDGPQVLPLVPDVSSWSYKGPALVHNIDVDQFDTTVTNVTTFGTGVNVYSMFVDSKTRLPVQLRMQGINFIMGSHPDLYIFDYSQFVTNVSSSEFDVPSLCTSNSNDAWRQRRSHFRVRAAIGRLAVLVPPTQHAGAQCQHEVHPRFHDYAVTHRKHYASCDEHEARQSVFLDNLNFIESWNADASHSHTVAVNHLADLTDEEYRALILLPRDGQARKMHAARATKTHKADSSVGLPRFVDWLAKGVVAPIKDQGACGSCWTFGSQTALEGQAALKNGYHQPLSEQQLVDCAWGYFGNQACDGGFAAGAYQYLIDAGGVATEASYAYLEQDGWCNANDHSSGIVVTGYVNITDQPSLLQALATVGPIAVAMDASLSSFRFAHHGVYYDPACKNDADSLDHEVSVVQLHCGSGSPLCDGTGPNGPDQDWMLLRNSWSTYWGANGYIKIRTQNNMCGLATSATYPLI
jgi:C1A family cysteine protease